MPDIVGIRFKPCGKIYDFDVDGLDVKKGDAVVVESELGTSIGNVVFEKRQAADTKKEFKKVLRKVSEGDIKQSSNNEALRLEARAFCAERIMARGLPMKLTDTEVILDRKRIIFYFVAENRIDFRELVKDLAIKFKTRIEMRQIGVRDEAKLLGGLGSCGRELCCRTFLTSFEPISIRMAKSQDISLNASKLSGACGRLMCCLSFEYCDSADGNAQCGKAEQPTYEDEENLIDIVEEPPAVAATVSDAPKMDIEGGEADGGDMRREDALPAVESLSGDAEDLKKEYDRAVQPDGAVSGDAQRDKRSGRRKKWRRRRFNK